MRKIYLILLFIVPLCSFAQPNQGVNTELGLRADLIFGTKISMERYAKVSFMDGYLLETDIEDHPIFDHIGLIHDDQNQLMEYSYSCSSKDKTEKYKERILSSIEKYYGLRSKPDSGEYGITWAFRKGDDFAKFNIEKGQCTLTLSTNNLIKAKVEFDKDKKMNIVTVSGVVTNFHEFNANGKDNSSEYYLWFEGLPEKKAIILHFNPTQKDCKLFKFIINDSITVAQPATWRQFLKRYHNYVNELELPRQLADNIYQSSKTTIVTTGELADQIVIPDRILKMYKVIYEYLYK